MNKHPSMINIYGVFFLKSTNIIAETKAIIKYIKGLNTNLEIKVVKINIKEIKFIVFIISPRKSY